MKYFVLISLIGFASPSIAGDDYHAPYEPSAVTAPIPQNAEEYSILVKNGKAAQRCGTEEMSVEEHQRCNYEAFGKQTEGGE